MQHIDARRRGFYRHCRAPAAGLGAVTYLGENVAWTATNALRAELAWHCLNLDMSFHNDHTPGEMIERIDGDVTELANFFSQFVVTLIGNVPADGGHPGGPVLRGLARRAGLYPVFGGSLAGPADRVRDIAMKHAESPPPGRSRPVRLCRRAADRHRRYPLQRRGRFQPARAVPPAGQYLPPRPQGPPERLDHRQCDGWAC